MDMDSRGQLVLDLDNLPDGSEVITHLGATPVRRTKQNGFWRQVGDIRGFTSYEIVAWSWDNKVEILSALQALAFLVPHVE